MPEAGATVGAVSASTGRRPVDCGKGGDWLPELLPNLLPGAVPGRGSGTGGGDSDPGRRSRIAMVGDRLDTDVAFGQQCGFVTLLPLSGVTSLPMLRTLQQEHSSSAGAAQAGQGDAQTSSAQTGSPLPWPDFVIDSVAELRLDE